MYYTVTPLPHELLSSWIIRNSILNGTDPLGFAGGVWCKTRVWTKDIDRYLSIEERRQLQKLTPLSLSQIQNMTLEPIYTKLINPDAINSNKHWDYIIPTGIRNRTKTNGLHYCPLCLKESTPYLKKHWRLSWNCVCEKHLILLHLNCDNCNHCFSPHLITYTDTDFTKCQYCHSSLVDKKIISIQPSVLELQRFLNLSLQDEKINPNSYPIIDQNISDLFATVRGLMLFFRDLTHLKSYHSYKDDLFKEMNYSYKALKKEKEFSKINIDALPVNQRYQLLEIISHLFQFSLLDIISMLKKIDISKQLFTRSIKIYSPTLMKISKSLINRPKKPSRKPSHIYSEYQPHSKEEIELLMDKIRDYL